MGEFSQRSLSKHKNTHENWQFAPQSGLTSCSTKKKNEWSTGWLYLSPCNFNGLLQHLCLHIRGFHRAGVFRRWGCRQDMPLARGKAETKSERSKYLSSCCWALLTWVEHLFKKPAVESIWFFKVTSLTLRFFDLLNGFNIHLPVRYL